MSDTTSKAIEPNAVYSVEAAARLVELNPFTLRQKLRTGAIKGKKRGQWRILGAELLKMA